MTVPFRDDSSPRPLGFVELVWPSPGLVFPYVPMSEYMRVSSLCVGEPVLCSSTLFSFVRLCPVMDVDGSIPFELVVEGDA